MPVQLSQVQLAVNYHIVDISCQRKEQKRFQVLYFITIALSLGFVITSVK